MKIFKLVYAQIDLKHCVVTIKDNGSNTVTVKIGDGNLTWDETVNYQYYLNRGLLDSVRLGDQAPVEVKLDATYEYILGDAAGTGVSVEDALKKRGAAATWVSTDTDTCNPYCVNIQMVHTPICNGVKLETVLLAQFRCEKFSHDPKAGTLSFSGKCNITQATVTRTTQSTTYT